MNIVALLAGMEAMHGPNSIGSFSPNWHSYWFCRSSGFSAAKPSTQHWEGYQSSKTQPGKLVASWFHQIPHVPMPWGAGLVRKWFILTGSISYSGYVLGFFAHGISFKITIWGPSLGQHSAGLGVVLQDAVYVASQWPIMVLCTQQLEYMCLETKEGK